MSDSAHHEESTAAKLLRGAAWTYAAQVFTIIVQFAYAAFTSRVVDPTSFGIYSVALTAVGLMVLLSAGGVAQSVARARDLGSVETGSLLTFAFVSGLCLAALTWLGAGLLARMWGSPASAPALQLLAVNVFAAPLFGLFAGVCRRHGRFKPLALLTVIANVAGMAIGAVAVSIWRSPEALVASTIMSQLILVVGAAALAEIELRPRKLELGSEVVTFSRNLTLVSLFQYWLGAVPRLAVSHFVGVSAIGQWNRAEVLSTLPFQQVQAAVLPVVYPEFRDDRDDAKRAQRRWADMVAVVAWLTVPAGVVGALLMPKVVPFILGDQWPQAAAFAVALCIAGGIQPPTVLLASALEALGQFRIIWIVSLTLAALQVAVVGLVAMSRSAWPALVALGVGHLVAHALYVLHARRLGYLNVRTLLDHYRRLVVAAVMIALVVSALMHVLDGSSGVYARVASGFVVLTALAWSGFQATSRRYRRLAPIRLAMDTGLLRR